MKDFFKRFLAAVNCFQQESRGSQPVWFWPPPSSLLPHLQLNRLLWSEKVIFTCVWTATPGVTYSLSHTHTHTGTLQKQLDGRAIWLQFLKGVPRPGVCPLSDTAAAVWMKSALSTPDAFPSLSLCFSCRARSVSQGSSRRPGLQQRTVRLSAVLWNDIYFTGKVND